MKNGKLSSDEMAMRLIMAMPIETVQDTIQKVIDRLISGELSEADIPMPKFTDGQAHENEEDEVRMPSESEVKFADMVRYYSGSDRLELAIDRTFERIDSGELRPSGMPAAAQRFLGLSQGEE
ncbi:hypothetical protein IFT62_21845 [Pseudomonas lutea]|uniref:Uncharacterized protein n=1 Tax=Pseudomonas lutea TaxID=243924 RepID=A0ABR9AD91_9PSED|nr:hypothetical protein [Pseudomonas lutea]MBD8123849.1 hypothetical protein [Pseudomonas lutea]